MQHGAAYNLKEPMSKSRTEQVAEIKAMLELLELLNTIPPKAKQATGDSEKPAKADAKQSHCDVATSQILGRALEHEFMGLVKEFNLFFGTSFHKMTFEVSSGKVIVTIEEVLE